MTVHTETERKYEVEAGTEPPSLAEIDGVAEVSGPTSVTLEAVYFDTPDLRLLRHGVTMRRRTGGSDAGWHLKVPTGEDTRDELREPLTGDGEAPPKTLRDLVVGMARGAELRPAAKVDTARRTWELVGCNGKALATVTEDSVTASALAEPATTREWRELEVELAGHAAPKTLDRVEKSLRQAGFRRSTASTKVARVLPARSSPPSGRTAGDVVLAYVSGQVAAILRHDVGIRRNAEDAVHQMRVATRRLRGALRVFNRVVDRRRTSALSGELRWLGRRLGPARDLEVQERHFHESVSALPDELVMGPVAARLTRTLSPETAAAREKVLKTLAGKRYRALLDELDRLVTAPPLTKRARRPAHRELPRHLRRAHRKTVRRMEAVPAGAGRDHELHRTRKAARRVRYGLECVEPVIGRKAKRSRKTAKALTKLLGEHQDAVVVKPVLRRLGAQAHLSGENGFTFGLLHEQESRRCRDVERELPARWTAFTSRKTRGWFS